MKRGFLIKVLAVICAFIVPCMAFSACVTPPDKDKDDTQGTVTPNPDDGNKDPESPDPDGDNKDPVDPDDKDPETPDPGDKDPVNPDPDDKDPDIKPDDLFDVARIDVTTADGSNDWATVWSSFDNNLGPIINGEVKDWEYQACTVSVSNCKEDYVLNDIAAEIKVRGNWTTTYAKKPFRIKFNKKQAMLGLNDGAKCKSWVLLANYKDVSLLRNSVDFYLGQQILGEDGYYCSDYQFVDLYLNSEFWGSYLLCEQQQVNQNRIDITEPEKNYTGTDIGYFVEFDGYYNLEIEEERFSMNYNNWAPLKNRDGKWFTPWQNGYSIKNDIYDFAQTTFIKNYMNNLYNICYKAVYNKEYYMFNDDFTGLVAADTTDVLSTVEKVIDINSLVDTYILNEIACDYDINWSSFLMDVDFGSNAKDNLLRFEAPWDFDSAYGLRDACAGADWLFAANSENPWLVLFINESWFQTKVKDKWQALTANNLQNNTLELIKTYQKGYAQHFKDNFDRWSWDSVFWTVQGEFCWGAQQVSSHVEAADYFYNWLAKRFKYLDSIWGK